MSRARIVLTRSLTITWASVLASVPLVRASGQGNATIDSAATRSAIGTARWSAGYTRFDVGDINARFAGAGLPPIARGAATFGLGTDVRMGRFVVSGGWQTMIARSAESSVHRTRLAGDLALLDLALPLRGGEHVVFYPIVGAGARHITVKVEERGGFVFDDALSHPGRGVDMTGATFLYDLGFGAERRLTRGRPVVVSVRAGLLRSVGGDRWSASSGSSIQAGPRAMRGSYLQLGMATPLQSRRSAMLPLAGTAFRALRR